MRLPLLSPTALHIPDGFLNLPVSLFFWLVTAISVGLAVRRSRTDFTERQAPLMGIMAAFIFAGQMINFPIAGGTSGHFLGGALAAITLGPWAAILVMTTVVGVQALIFQDGGLVVMGANIFNMGILTVVISYGIYRAFDRRSLRIRYIAAGFGAWLSVVAGALFTALQLWLSGIVTLQVVVPVMLGIHAVIGLGEAVITVAALSFVGRLRPDVFHNQADAGGRSWVFAGLLAALVVVFLAPFASTNPDGLERAATDLGFIGTAQTAPFRLLSGYTISALGKSGISTIASGIVGLSVVAVLVFVIAKSFRTRKHRS